MDFDETHALIFEGYFDRVIDPKPIRLDQLAKKVGKATHPDEAIKLVVEVGPVPVLSGMAIGDVPAKWDY